MKKTVIGLLMAMVMLLACVAAQADQNSDMTGSRNYAKPVITTKESDQTETEETEVPENDETTEEAPVETVIPRLALSTKAEPAILQLAERVLAVSGSHEEESGWYTFTPAADGVYTISYELEYPLSNHVMCIYVYDTEGNSVFEMKAARGEQRLICPVELVKNNAYTIHVTAAHWSVGDSYAAPLAGDYNVSVCSGSMHVDSADQVVLKYATCDEKGQIRNHCSACGAEISVSDMPATEHSLDEWVVENEITCSEAWEVRYCLTCKQVVERRSVEKLPHIEGEMKQVKAPSCEGAGLMASNCTVCGVQMNTVSIAPVGHDNGYWEVTTAPKCDKAGVESRKCSICSKVLETRSVAATGHVEGEYVRTEKTCVDGTEISYCTVCGKSVDTRITAATGHTPAEEVYTAPTCQKEGSNVVHCIDCGVVLSEEAIPMVEHKAGLWKVTVRAGLLNGGERVRFCEYNCYERMEVEYTPASLSYVLVIITGVAVVVLIASVIVLRVKRS